MKKKLVMDFTALFSNHCPRMAIVSGIGELNLERDTESAMEVDWEEERSISDVSMPDYTQEEEASDVEGKVTIEEAKEEDAEGSEASFQTDAKALVQAILQPESQGYKVARHQADTEVIRPNEGPVVIHNHYYNNVFAYPGGGHQDRTETVMHDQDLNLETVNVPAYDARLRTLNVVKQTLNYSIGIFFLGILFRNVASDIRNEYAKLNHIKMLKIDQCKREYFVNKCDEYGQLPALKDLCLEWSLCFSDEFHPEDTTFYTQLAFQVVGALINGFLDKVGNLNKVFLVALVAVWYGGNFLCGYYKGAAHLHESSNALVKKQQ